VPGYRFDQMMDLNSYLLHYLRTEKAMMAAYPSSVHAVARSQLRYIAKLLINH